jgi:dUTP pyrophosphatase
MSLTVSIQPLHPEIGKALPAPKRMSDEAAGMDVVAANDEPIELLPGKRALIPCGFAMAFPAGFECQVRPRSGLAAKHGITVLNSPGTIDSDYRGEVKGILVNLGEAPFTVRKGERVAQLVFAAVALPGVELVARLEDTNRGTGGFGSTGQ